LSGGEAILRPEATQAFGKHNIDQINLAARRGGSRKVSELMGHLGHVGYFANGGMIPHLGNFARGGYIHGAGAGRLSPVTETHAKFVAGYFPDIFTLTSAERYTDTGFHAQMKATDWSNGGNAGTPEMKKLASAIHMNFPSSAELIHWPLAGWQNIWEGQPHNYGAGTNAEHRNHVHWATHSPLRFDGDDIILDDMPGGGGFSFNPLDWFTGLWDRVIGPLPKFNLQGFGDMADVPGAALSTFGGWLKDWALGKLKEWADKLMNFMGFGGGGAEQWRGRLIPS
jgi:hypothetical protein